MARVVVLVGGIGSGRSTIFSSLMKLSYTQPLVTIPKTNNSNTIDGLKFDSIHPHCRPHHHHMCEVCDNFRCHDCRYCPLTSGAGSLIKDIDFSKDYTYVAILSYSKMVELKRAIDNRCNVMSYYIDCTAKTRLERELLTDNYKSDDEICKLAEAIVSDNTNCIPFKDKCDTILYNETEADLATCTQQIISALEQK